MEQQSRPTGAPPLSAPRFYLTDRRPPRPTAILLAVVIAVGALSPVVFAKRHAGRVRPADAAERTPGSTASHAPEPEEKDDPSQVDTIVLGDAADAPEPARKRDPNARPSNVHATILIHLPRFGEQTGLIPDSPAGHLLYGWLAAFNQASLPALGTTLPNDGFGSTANAQMALRQETGGFNLLSAREVQPGVLVFRLRDQTPEGNEVLGTLQVRQGASPAAIATFSLRGIPPVGSK